MIYSPLKISARPYLSILDINNKWIWKDCKHVINVSQKDQPDDIKNIIMSKGATYQWFPLTENEDFNKDSYLRVVDLVIALIKTNPDEEIIVHCTGGNNRSRLVCEAAYYKITNKVYFDPYIVDGKEYSNHTDYNIKQGFFKE